MTDAELDIIQRCIDMVGESNTTLEMDLADDLDRIIPVVRRLRAEVERLQANAAIDSDNMVRFLARAEQAETELFQAKDSERRAVNALEMLRARVKV